MDPIIRTRGMTKRYGSKTAVNNIDLDVLPGRIVGLIGPNGAGKTTALKGILGLAPVDGELQVLNKDPRKQRTQLLNDVSFIADTAILPKWLKVYQAMDYMQAVHPNFSREKADELISLTNIPLKNRIRTLSKGMITQLHLSLIMAIDSKLLVLDEPTLGLDIIFRKQFYTNLLNDYFDEEKTILITTHQVEEIETILTDLIFINRGEILLNCTMEEMNRRYTEVHVSSKLKTEALALNPLGVNEQLGGSRMIFEDQCKKELEKLGTLHTPSVADVFVAKVQASTH